MEIQVMKSKDLLAFESSLQIEIAKAIVFCGSPIESSKEVSAMAENVIMIFQGVESQKIMKAIQLGYSGYYGRSYKFSLQELCLWIRCFIDNKRPRDYERTIDEI